MTTTAGMCRAHAALLTEADRCDHWLDDRTRRNARDDDLVAARRWISAAAEHCRRATAVFELDPTLADEPWVHEVDVLVEVVRQVRSMCRIVLRAPAGEEKFARHGESARLQWHEAGVLVARVPELADRVLAAARAHDTVDGQQAISRTRLHREIDWLREIAERRPRLDPALAVPHPDPRARAISDLLDQLAEQVASVRAEITNARETHR